MAIIKFEGDVRLAWREKLVQALTDPQSDFEIWIDSPGGRSYPAEIVLGTIRHITLVKGISVKGLVTGEAASAAFMILQSCTIRHAVSTARLMFHAPRTLLLGGKNAEDPSPWHDEINPKSHLYTWLLETLRVRSGITQERLEEWGTQERYFSAEEALEYGFIDRIVPAPN